MSNDRDLWIPYYEQTEASTFGDDWPVWIVARWERNGIGETRFTGETRVYRAEPKTELDPEVQVESGDDLARAHEPR